MPIPLNVGPLPVNAYAQHGRNRHARNVGDLVLWRSRSSEFYRGPFGFSGWICDVVHRVHTSLILYHARLDFPWRSGMRDVMSE